MEGMSSMSKYVIYAGDNMVSVPSKIVHCFVDLEFMNPNTRQDVHGLHSSHATFPSTIRPFSVLVHALLYVERNTSSTTNTNKSHMRSYKRASKCITMVQ